MKARLLVGLLAAITVGHDAVAADCPQGAMDDAVKCIAAELRSTDALINENYQTLLKALSDDAKVKLRNEQRDWLKERDATCKVDTKESDRERWYQALLTDHNKTVCVIRYTRVRSAELSQQLAKLQPALPPQPVSAPTAIDAELYPKSPYAYWQPSSQTWRSGKWYWEVTVNVDGISKFHPTALSIRAQAAS